MIVLLGALLISADPAVAGQAATEPAAAPAPAPVKEKKICKNLDGDTGTHFSRRVCKTADDWATMERDGGRSGNDLKTLGAH